MKQYERKREGESKIDGDIDLGRSLELATSDKIYVNSLNLHEIRNEILLD